VPSEELEIDPATYVRGFAEIGLARTMEKGTLTLIPRLFCVTNSDGSQDDACGAGALIAYETLAEVDTNAQWDVSFDYEVIDERQTASVAVARSSEIFDGAGVSRSRFNATATGVMQLEQTLEFSW
jgi:diaminopimelate epimerase